MGKRKKGACPNQCIIVRKYVNNVVYPGVLVRRKMVFHSEEELELRRLELYLEHCHEAGIAPKIKQTEHDDGDEYFNKILFIKLPRCIGKNSPHARCRC